MNAVDSKLLDRLDIRSALETEISTQRDLLPVQVIDLAAADRLDEVAAIVSTRAHEGRLGAEAAPVLAASKWRHGRRPAAALPLPERVLYRAATELLTDGLAEIRARDDHSEFVNAPVENDDDFVIVTDLSNYYSSIHLDRLAAVLLSRTGEWAVVSWLHDFLSMTSPTLGGLPQGNFSSDRLADTYADTLLRKLRRRGLTAWRYSDDFRISAKTFQDATNALDIFDEETRDLGLYINERKTFVVPKGRYVSNLDQEHTYFSEAWKEKRDSLTTVDWYSMMSVEPEDAEVLRAVALEELNAWAAEADGLSDDAKMVPARLHLDLVLNILSTVSEPAALEYVPNLLMIEPQLTYRVAKYLHSMSTHDADGVDKAIAATIEKVALNKWKSVWLAYALSNPKGRDNDNPFSLGIPADVLGWLESMSKSGDEVVAAHAVWSLAVSGKLTMDTWSELNSKLGAYSTQFSAAALAGIPGDQKSQLESGDQLERIVYEWGRSVLR